ncbi:MAG: phosphate-starvation-inducible PsiE family protein [Paracoccaceae bacterium]|jgi:uncharacterized membrane protein (DUF373 family)|nr:phosphate-starvation-inducible PsiE family protein [Paracoccaceae bacterium]
MNFSRVYVRFERVMAFLILAGMVVVIGLTLFSFFLSVWGVVGTLPQEMGYTVFQTLFDRVLAAIIALEIAHSIREMVSGRHGRAQLRTVVVIGMLAVVRKLVVLDVQATSGGFLAGLAAVILALGITLAIINTVAEKSDPPAAPGSEH